jgi:hypothetical protein
MTKSNLTMQIYNNKYIFLMANIIYINIKAKKYKKKFKKIKDIPEVHSTKTKISKEGKKQI